MKTILTLILIISLFGCMSEKKATDYLKKKDKLDDVCAAEFPVKEVFVQGKDSISFDTMFLETLATDTVKTKDTIYITKYLPQKVVTVTKMRVDTFYRRDLAKEHVLGDQLRDSDNANKKLSIQNAELTQDVSNWRHKAHSYFWVIVVLVILLFRKPLWGLVSNFTPLKYLSTAKKL